MKVAIQSIHFDADQKLIEFITSKVEKVNTFDGAIHIADVFLRLEKSSEKNNKAVEIRMNLSGFPVFAKESSNTFETAVYLAVEKVRSQVIKHKEKGHGKN
jgi:putative sigma-54 modulation protein